MLDQYPARIERVILSMALYFRTPFLFMKQKKTSTFTVPPSVFEKQRPIITEVAFPPRRFEFPWILHWVLCNDITFEVNSHGHYTVTGN